MSDHIPETPGAGRRLEMGWSRVAFTPHGGRPIAIAGVTSLRRIEEPGGTTLVAVETIDAAGLDAIPIRPASKARPGTIDIAGADAIEGTSWKRPTDRGMSELTRATTGDHDTLHRHLILFANGPSKLAGAIAAEFLTRRPDPPKPISPSFAIEQAAKQIARQLADPLHEIKRLTRIAVEREIRGNWLQRLLRLR